MNDVSPELLQAARAQKTAAVTELLAMNYPMVWRIATGLTGREDVGRGVAAHIMRRSLTAMTNWKDDGAPARWFSHHTLLAARRTTKHAPELEKDTLLANSANDIPLLAFVRALRLLPLQQREAFILSHLENLGPRQMAVAMDCSTVAAETHLREANRQMLELAEDQFGNRVAQLSQIYMSQAPDEELTLAAARKQVSRLLVPWRLLRALNRILLLVFLIGFAWAAWWFWRIIAHSLRW